MFRKIIILFISLISIFMMMVGCTGNAVNDHDPESYVIRWYIDSDPQGADAYWRVKSSNEEVTNTNERYLGTTPFEETRALDIPNLDKDNAVNVSIEIVVRKRGYLDQTKTFNCKAILDEREINTKYLLVEEVKDNGNNNSNNNNDNNDANNDWADLWNEDEWENNSNEWDNENWNNESDTSLDELIIRWAIDSDPQGAAIFWRVISSNNDVQNTTDTYLSTTPYQQTKAFDIQGLTYENSEDVEVEIKVSKKGYYDQSQRINMRSAIDQKEISIYFMLVEKD